MTTQFDDVVKDAKRSAKQEIAEYLKRQNGSSTVIDTDQGRKRHPPKQAA